MLVGGTAVIAVGVLGGSGEGVLRGAGVLVGGTAVIASGVLGGSGEGVLRGAGVLVGGTAVITVGVLGGSGEGVLRGARVGLFVNVGVWLSVAEGVLISIGVELSVGTCVMMGSIADVACGAGSSHAATASIRRANRPPTMPADKTLIRRLYPRSRLTAFSPQEPEWPSRVSQHRYIWLRGLR